MTNDISSLTTELYGILATNIIIYVVLQHHEIENEASIEIVVTTDNKQAIQTAQQCTSPINISETLKPEYDLQELLHSICKEIQSTITYKWIKGHQDQLSSGEKNTWTIFSTSPTQH